MKKKLLLVITAMILMLITLFSVSAAEKTVTLDGVTYELKENKTDGKFYRVRSFTDLENTEKIIIKEKIDGIPVLSVDVRFDKELPNDENYSVKKIILPEGLKYIEDYALSNFKSVKEITLPSTLVRIDFGGLSGMESLKSITLPKGITKIADKAFDGCKSLSKVTFKGKVTVIGSNAFAYCTGLKKISLPTSLKKLGAGAFRGSGLTSVTVPAKTDVSSPEIFRDCKSLKKVVFDGCTHKKGLALGTRIFYGCLKLKSVTFDDVKTVASVGKNAFEKTAKGIKFVAENKKIATAVKKKIKASGMKNPTVGYVKFVTV